MMENDKPTYSVVEHFMPTTDSPRWRGKMRCAYCPKTGWHPASAPWARKHGAACIHRPDAAKDSSNE